MTTIVPLPVSSLSPIDYLGQRVVTLSMMDQVHGRPAGTARKRLNDHKNKLVEGRHCYLINLSEFRTAFPGVAPERGGGTITVLTERGYLVLVKSFTDDLAWQVQEQLVDGYFRAATAVAALPSGFSLETLSPAMASQIGGIMKAVSKKQHEESEARMAAQFALALTQVQQDFDARFKEVSSSKQVSLRKGKTAGQLWRDYKLEAIKNASNWFSARLSELNCQIDGGGCSESGGIKSKLFDPDKTAVAMKGGLHGFCKQYVQQRNGQAPMFPGQ